MKVLFVVCALFIPALGGMSDARSAPGATPLQPPAASSSATTPPWPDTPGGGTVTDTPTDSSREPNFTPLPAPAVTNHYAGSAENIYIALIRIDYHCAARIANRVL